MRPSRRNFLIGGVTVAAAAIPVAVPATIANENPVLLEIKDALPAALHSFRHAKEEYAAALKTFYALAPAVPSVLVFDREKTKGWRHLATEERCANGDMLHSTFDGEVRLIFKANLLRKASRRHAANTRLGKEIRRRLATAELFEADYQRALCNSAYEPANTALKSAKRIVTDLGEAAGGAEARTMLGIVIKARAFAALGEAEGFETYNRATFIFGNQLLSEINSIMGTE